MVSSRAMCVIDNAGKTIFCIVPRHDLANHVLGCENMQYRLNEIDGEAVHELLSTRSTESGAELYICYGEHKSNAALLSTYGFVVPGNINDRLPLGAPGRWTGFGCLASECAILDARMCMALAALGVEITTGALVQKGALPHNDQPARVQVLANGHEFTLPHAGKLSGSISRQNSWSVVRAQSWCRRERQDAARIHARHSERRRAATLDMRCNLFG